MKITRRQLRKLIRESKAWEGPAGINIEESLAFPLNPYDVSDDGMLINLVFLIAPTAPGQYTEEQYYKFVDDYQELLDRLEETGPIDNTTSDEDLTEIYFEIAPELQHKRKFALQLAAQEGLIHAADPTGEAPEGFYDPEEAEFNAHEWAKLNK